ncbi:MAG TPA: intradiol ring-cleavage dioxygenase [Rhizobacter sp.]|nr:intradiol ring-cleavage dioxygenase [Rhizobacter sp.]
MQHDKRKAAHDHGLAHDLTTLLSRRRTLLWLAGTAGVASAPLLACGGGGDDDSSSTATSSSGSDSTGSTSSSGSCAVIPEETAGPYPGDGSNSNGSGIANALALSGIVRSDIRSSIAGATGTAAGVPLTLRLTLVNTRASCADLSGHAIYLWHCDREGRYSMYSSGVTAQNYLRGVQETASDGTVVFGTIFPGCYDGRMPHMHFEVYRSLSTALSYSNKLKTSQLSFPVATCSEVYATSGYSASVANLARISFATDNVFSDGTSLQIASISGNPTDGYVAELTVGISV